MGGPPKSQSKQCEQIFRKIYVFFVFNMLNYYVAILFSLYYNSENEQQFNRNGSRTMFQAMKENSAFNNGFAKEFAALSSLCAAGYLWLLLI